MIDLNTIVNTIMVLIVSGLGAVASYRFTIAKAERIAKENRRVENENQIAADKLQEKQMNRMDARIAALEKKIAEQDATIDAQEATIRMLRGRIVELETQNTKKDLRIAELEAEIRELKSREVARS